MTQIQDPFPKLPPDAPLYLQIRVVPRQSKTAFCDVMDDGTIKIHLRATPEKGKANAELQKFLASHYDVKPASVEIISGATDRQKLVRIKQNP